MKTIHRLALAALLPLGACADAAPTETAAAPAGPSAVMAPSPACITFGPPPPAWTVWGAPVPQAPGTVVHTEASIPVTVEQFNDGLGWVYNMARIEPAASIGWGTANSLHLLGIS
ncbi:MAG TPA: hypothetical protein VK358_05585, partial [Longimicrobium sp.]|nr:hypothetical protein [Longimicrobium sp.]